METTQKEKFKNQMEKIQAMRNKKGLFSEEAKEEVRKFHKNGFTAVQIASELKIPVTTVYGWLKRKKEIKELKIVEGVSSRQKLVLKVGVSVRLECFEEDLSVDLLNKLAAVRVG